MRVFGIFLIATIAWGALAFGAVYPWAYWPLAIASAGLGLWGIFDTRAWADPRTRHLGIAVIAANIQDRDCAANLIRKTRHLFPWIAKIFADGGYAGAKLKAALAGQPVELEIVKRTDNDAGFKVALRSRRSWTCRGRPKLHGDVARAT